MRRGIFFLGVCLFALAPSVRAAVEVEPSPERTVYHFHLGEPTFSLVEIEGAPLWKAQLSGAYPFDAVLYEIGRPELPAIRFFLDGEGEITVRVGQPQDNPPPAQNVRLKPSLPPLLKNNPAAAMKLFFDESVYQIDELQPAVTFDVEEVGTIAGVRRRQVTLFPLRYNPVTGESRFISELAVDFQHEGQVPSVPQTLENETIAFVVGERFAKSPSLRRLAEFKNHLGYGVRWLVVGAEDKPPAIRRKLMDWYEDAKRPLTHVLLVGDRQDVPGFASEMLDSVTDHYYASLDTKDYEDDVATPDVGVGRFMVSDEADLALLIDKQVHYQRGDALVADADVLKEADTTYCTLREPRPLPWVAPRACVAKVFGVEEWREPSHTIASWGAIDATFVEEDRVLERFLQTGIRLPGKLVFGDLTRFALAEVWRHYGGTGLSRYYWEAYVTLGDPSASLRTTDAREVRVEGPKVLPVGTSEISLFVTDLMGNPVSGARVGLSGVGRDYRVSGRTDLLGRVRLELSEGYWGMNEFRLSVSGENIRLWEGNLKFVDFAPDHRHAIL